ncbi:MAG: VanZ family protein [Deltaproteobacteria bacterium]|nr:VanZ family protein [Deltaproteobacteria bacterium]
MSKKNLLAWIPFVLYCALIFYFSSQPEWPSPLQKFKASDKVLHFVEYGILGFLWMLGVWRSRFRNSWVWIGGIFFILLFGASDEWHQSFVVGREMALGDWVADSLGGIVGLFAAHLVPFGK